MAKELKYNLTVTANTEQAKKEMKALQYQLDQLTSARSGNLLGKTFNKDMADATRKIAQLKVQLESAFNADTGKIDFVKFNQQLTQSGMKLKDYAIAMSKIGTDGVQAFTSVAKALAAAEIPAFRMGTKLKELSNTLSNTLRWQISSSALHGLMGAVQTAYGYAQDLNKSLNNIRIVTQQSTEQMAQFAEYANQSAKALSTTTTNVTNAALIYYQQGLSDQEVKERTETTIKLANVTKDTAETVSSQMTAIWNNFDDGSKKLEYYADAITALGAATASSSAEIAQGLQKFAAVSDTVGLSYEYATAALATVVAQTRQSADIVGTAFKTLFGRLEGLKLGETLEDGTDLNKYSEALFQVGVNIKQDNGELKAMDTILDELGAKWKTLSEDQQMALAQTVGGVRQYTQLIALMENYDEFKKNVDIAANSEGRLQEQQEIYAESWEAASKRVQASAEGIYDALLNDKFFIDINNKIADILEGTERFIEVLGGVKGLLVTIAPLIANMYSQQMTDGLRNMALNLQTFTKSGREKLKAQRSTQIKEALDSISLPEKDRAALEKELQITRLEVRATEELNETNQKIFQSLVEQAKQREKNVELAEKENATAKENYEKAKGSTLVQFDEKQLKTQQRAGYLSGLAFSSGGSFSKDDALVRLQMMKSKDYTKEIVGDYLYNQILNTEEKATESQIKSLFEAIRKKVEQVKTEAVEGTNLTSTPGAVGKQEQVNEFGFKNTGKNLGDPIRKMYNTLQKADAADLDDRLPLYQKFLSQVEDAKRRGIKLNDNFKEYIAKVKEWVTKEQELIDGAEDRIKQAAQAAGEAAAQEDVARQAAEDMPKRAEREFNQLKASEKIDWAQTFTASTQAITAFGSALNSAISIGRSWKQWADSDGKDINSFLETLGQNLLSISFSLPMVMQGLKAMQPVLERYSKNNRDNIPGFKGEDSWTSGLGMSTSAGQRALKDGASAKKAVAASAVELAGLVAVLVAALKLLDFVYTEINNRSFDNTLKKQKKAVEELQGALNAATDEAEQLKNNLDKYDSVVSKLNECSKGTEEWNDALHDVNQTVLEILAKYPELAQFGYAFRNSETGALEITEEGKKYLEEISKNRVLNAQLALNAGNLGVSKAEQDRLAHGLGLRTTSYLGGSNYSKMAERQRDQIESSTGNAALAAAAYGSQKIGSFLSLGGLDLLSDIFSNKNNDEFVRDWNLEYLMGSKGLDPTQALLSRREELIGRTDEEFQNNTRKILTDIYPQLEENKKALDELSNAVLKNKDDFLELAEAAEQATKQEDLMFEAAIGEKYSEYSAEVQKVLVREAKKDYAQTREDILNRANGDEDMDLTSDFAKELAERYSKATGYSYTLAEDAIRGTDSNRSQAFLNSEGKEVIFGIEQIANTISAFEAVADRAKDADKAAETISKISDDTIKKFIGSEDLSKATKEELDKWGTTWEEFYKKMVDYYKDSGLNEEDIENLGYETWGDFVWAMWEGAKNARDDFNIEDLPSDMQTALGGLQAKDVKQIVETRKGIDSSEELNAYDSLIKNVYKKLSQSPKDYQKAIEAINATAFNDADSIEELDKVLSKLGVDIDKTSLIESFKAMANIDYNSIAEKYKSIQELLTLKTGDTIDITEKKYENVPKELLQEFFTQTEDGLYQLTTDADEFYKAVKGQQTHDLYSEIKDNISNIEQTRQRLDNKNLREEERKGLQEQLDAFQEKLNQGMQMALNSADSISEVRGLTNGETTGFEGYINNATKAMVSASGLDYDTVITQGKDLAEVYGLQEDRARELAVQNQLMNRGVKTLHDNWKDWAEVLKKSEKGSSDYSKAISETTKAIADLVGYTDELELSSGFVESHMKDLEKAAKGDEKAINKLSHDVGVDLVKNMKTGAASVEELKEEAEKASKENGFEPIDTKQWASDFDTAKNTLIEGIDKLYKDIEKIKPGDNPISAMGENWIAALNEMAMATKMSVEEMNAFLGSIGLTADVEVTTVPVKKKTQGIDYVPVDDNGTILSGMKAVPGETLELTDYVEVATINNKASVKYTGNGTVSSSSTKDKGKTGSKSKKKDEEKERYYVINNQIEDQTKLLDRLGKAKDRAFGAAKISLMERESKELEKQIDLQKKKLSEAEKYYKTDQAALNAFGAKYGENGEVTNYDEMWTREYNRYKKTGDETRWEDFKKKLKQYEDTRDLLYDLQDDIQDKLYELYDKSLEIIEYKVQIKVEVKEDELKLLDYYLNRLQKVPFTTARQLALMNDQLDKNITKQQTYLKGVEDILANHHITLDQWLTMSDEDKANAGFTEEEINTLRDYYGNIIDLQQAIDELEEKILSGPLEAFKEWNAEFEKQETLIEHNTSLLESYKDIADLLYSNNSRISKQFTLSLMEGSLGTQIDGVAAARAELEANRKERAKLEEQYQKETDENRRAILKKSLDEMDQTIMASEKDLLNKTKATLEAAKKVFDEKIDQAKDKMMELTNSTDWDLTIFDHLKSLDDQWLDDYEKIYHLSKLTRDVNNSIDSADTVRHRERLKEITQEILEIEESGRKVSQYEVDALRKKYELRLAEIALEDAQAAKNQVRMSRDNEGNWSYVYTASTDAADKALQNYEDKLYEYQKLNSDFIKQTQEEFLKAQHDFAEKAAEIMKDATLTPEQRRTQLAELQKYYDQFIGGKGSQLDTAFGYNKELQEKDWKDYHDRTGYMISAQQDYQTRMADSYYGVINPAIQSGTDAYNNFKNALDNVFSPTTTKAMEDWANTQDAILRAAGTSMTTFVGDVSGLMVTAADSSSQALDAVGTAAQKMSEDTDKCYEQIKQMNAQFSSDMRKTMMDAANSLGVLIGQYSEMSKAADIAYQKASQASSVTPPASGGNPGGTDKTKDKDKIDSTDSKLLITREGLAEALSRAALAISFGASNLQKKELGSTWTKYTTKESALKQLSYQDESFLKKIIDLTEYRKGSGWHLKHFDTGGYTGTWGNAGRLAVLHEKELVLNANDTKYMLDMVQIARDIIESASMKSTMTNIKNANANYNPGSLEQNVHIDASFPNVTDHLEIEQAFNNLVNMASQYANRK